MAITASLNRGASHQFSQEVAILGVSLTFSHNTERIFPVPSHVKKGPAAMDSPAEKLVDGFQLFNFQAKVEVTETP